MKVQLLNRTDKLILNTSDIANLLSISKKSANVSASRYVEGGYLIRFKKDFYILPSKFNSLSEEELFTIANLLQTPSYISLTTALSYYEITTQQQRNFIESIALKRTKIYKVKGIEFSFTLVKKKYYNGFILKDSMFIATPEKALADAIYLTSLNKYNCDFDAIDFTRINKDAVSVYLENTNKRTILFWINLCKTYRI